VEGALRVEGADGDLARFRGCAGGSRSAETLGIRMLRFDRRALRV